MKRILGLLLLSLLFVFPVFAKNPKSPADYNGLNKGTSSVFHLYLYQKDASWNIVPDGAWGKMTFNTDKNNFVANGHGLESNTDYLLVRYTESWPNLEVVDAATSDDLGDIHFAGDWGTWEGKFWIVLASDVAANHFTGWHPSEYLFEYNVL